MEQAGDAQVRCETDGGGREGTPLLGAARKAVAISSSSGLFTRAFRFALAGHPVPLTIVGLTIKLTTMRITSNECLYPFALGPLVVPIARRIGLAVRLVDVSGA